MGGVLRVHPEDLSSSNKNIDDSVRLPHLDELLEQMNCYARILRDKSDIQKRGYKPVYNHNVENRNAAKCIADTIHQHLDKISRTAVKYYLKEKGKPGGLSTKEDSNSINYLQRNINGENRQNQSHVITRQGEDVERSLDSSDSST